MSERWAWLKSEERDFEAVRDRLLAEAARAIPGATAEVMQADPVVVMLLRAFAREYVELYRLVDDSVDMAYRTLVARLIAFPRAPEPATTVLHIRTRDPGTPIPTDFEAISGRPINLSDARTAVAHFSPLVAGETSSFEVSALVYVDASGRATRLPDPPGQPQPDGWQCAARERPALFIALDSPAPSASDPVRVFLYQPDEGDKVAGVGVHACLWAEWEIPAAAGGGALRIVRSPGPEPLVPAREFHEATLLEPPLFTFRSDMRRTASVYETQLVSVGGEALLSQACPAPADLGERAVLPPAAGTRHWVRIALDRGVTLEQVRKIRARTNAFIASNREVGRSGLIRVLDVPVFDWALPENVSFENLLAVEAVIDREGKAGVTYAAATSPAGLEAPRRFRVLERWQNGRQQIQVEIVNLAPDRRKTQLEIVYSLTLGAAANGLGAGTINQAYSAAGVVPGLASVTNLVPARGGRPPRTVELAEEELRTTLRARGRAVVAADYVEMARAFDPERVRGVTLERGVVRGARGLRPSLVVRTSIASEQFVNELERDSFRRRLAAHLQDRSPVGETIEVQLLEAGA